MSTTSAALANQTRPGTSGTPAMLINRSASETSANQQESLYFYKRFLKDAAGEKGYYLDSQLGLITSSR